MQAGSKSGLTRALEELSTLLPKALECCTGTENSQNSPIVEKLRSVLLELIHGCLTCNAGTAPAITVQEHHPYLLHPPFTALQAMHSMIWHMYRAVRYLTPTCL